MAYDSLVEKTNKEKKTNSLWALLPCDFALGCVCAIAFLGSWQSFFQNDKTECVFWVFYPSNLSLSLVMCCRVRF
jgi:hypothetical protein